MHKISVIICAFKRERFIIDAINSVLDQTLERDYYEIIVSKSFVNEEIDRFITINNLKNIYIDSEKYGTRVAEAIKYSSGDIIITLDDDDMFRKDKLKTIFDIFTNDDSLAAVYNNFGFINADGHNIKSTFRHVEHKYMKKLGRYRFSNTNKASLRMTLKIGMPFGQMAIKKKVIVEHIDELYNVNLSIDTFLFTIIVASPHPIFVIPDELTLVRMHDEGETQYFTNDINVQKKIINIKKLTADYELFSEISDKVNNIALLHLMKDYVYLNKYSLCFLEPCRRENYFDALTRTRIINEFRNIRIFGWLKPLKISIGLSILWILYHISKEKAFCLFINIGGKRLKDCHATFRELNKCI